MRLTRAGTLADYFPPPFPNEEAARANNGGNLPPDLSMIVKAREGGAHYVYSILTGFHMTPPKGFTVTPGKYYNPYFEGWNIGMPPPLADNAGDLFRRHQGDRRRRKPMTWRPSWPGPPTPRWKSASGWASAC